MSADADAVISEWSECLLQHYADIFIRVLQSPSTTRHYAFAVDIVEALNHSPHLFLGALLQPINVSRIIEGDVVQRVQSSLLERAGQNATIKANVRFRPFNLPLPLNMTCLRSALIGRLVSTEITASRITNNKVYRDTRTFSCEKCRQSVAVSADIEMDCAITTPQRCPLLNAHKRACNGRVSESTSILPTSRDIQWLSGQTPLGSQTSRQTLPQSMRLCCRDELVDTIRTGETCILTGIVRRSFPGNFSKHSRNHVHLFLDVTHITHTNKPTTIQQHNIAGGTHGIQQFFRHYWRSYKTSPLYARNYIVKHVCPHLFAMFIPKLITILTCIGGSDKLTHDGDHRRSQIHCLLVGDAGTGKCFARDTSILMRDGSCKPVQNIQEHDVLVGDDGTSRHVLSGSLTSGVSQLYRIVPTRRLEPFVCNADHILVFDMLTEHRQWKRIEMSVKHYLKRFGNKSHRDRCLIRPAQLTFDDDYKSVLSRFVGNDDDALRTAYYIAYTCGRSRRDIPLAIMHGSVDMRRALLFGAINGCGGRITSCACRFDLTTCELTRQISHLALSLGFVVGSVNGENKTHLYISMSDCTGDSSSFSVERCGRGEYYGFAVDGNSRFLLSDYTVTHNSQLLTWASRISTRGVMTTGVGSSMAGLTVSAINSSNEWTLEAGALVLADRGVCCIDELGELSKNDRVALHEAMEQQTISIAKAGIVATVPTRCAVFAALNPKMALDSETDLTVTTALQSPLLSRFDVILLLMDKPQAEWDRRVAQTILNSFAPLSPAAKADGETDLTAEIAPLWPASVVRAYLQFVSALQPTLSPGAQKILRYYYTLQRAADRRDSARTTIRLLESLERISEAHARLCCRSVALPVDAISAIQILESSMQTHLIIGHAEATQTDGFDADPDGLYKALETSVLMKLGIDPATDLTADEIDYASLYDDDDAAPIVTVSADDTLPTSSDAMDLFFPPNPCTDELAVLFPTERSRDE